MADTSDFRNGLIIKFKNDLYSIVEFGLTQVKQDSETTLNRTNAPTGVLSYGSGSSGLPETSYLNPFDYQAVWLKLDLTAGASSQNSFYRLQVDGTTT